MREKQMSRKCRLYLVTLYCRLGETLPHKYRGKFSKRRQKRMSGIDPYGSSSSSDNEIITDQQESEAVKAEVFADNTHFARMVESGCGEHLADLPLRFLPPGNVRDLHLDMVSAIGNSSDRPSYMTFLRAYKDFSNILKFRSKGDFQDCDTCAAKKQAIKSAKRSGYRELYKATMELQQHYKEVTLSREIEASLRSTPPSAAKPILLIQTDGMDQAHWAIPRLPGWKAGKRFSNLARPKVIVQGAWCYYFGFHVVLGDATQAHDSNYIMEVLARVLEHVASVSRRRQIPVPEELCLWTDNTPRENKNQTVLMNLALLCGRGQFKTCTLANHIKGHSHNALDQVFGCLSRSFQHVDRLEDIYGVKRSIETILNKDSLRSFLAVPEVSVEVLEGVRDWSAYAQDLSVKLAGGMRDDATGIHCWMFLPRKDVPATYNIAPVDGFAPHPCDVVLLTKRYVWDSRLSQPPILVLPYERAKGFVTRFPVPTKLRPPKTPENHAETWLKVAKALLDCYDLQQVQRSVKYILSLARGGAC